MLAVHNSKACNIRLPILLLKKILALNKVTDWADVVEGIITELFPRNISLLSILSEVSVYRGHFLRTLIMHIIWRRSTNWPSKWTTHHLLTLPLWYSSFRLFLVLAVHEKLPDILNIGPNVLQKVHIHLSLITLITLVVYNSSMCQVIVELSRMSLVFKLIGAKYAHLLHKLLCVKRKIRLSTTWLCLVICISTIYLCQDLFFILLVEEWLATFVNFFYAIHWFELFKY